MSDAPKIFQTVLSDKVREYPGKARDVDRAKVHGRLLGVQGDMDYLNQVLTHCPGKLHTILNPSDDPPALKNYDVVLVGCPGKFSNPTRWLPAIQQFVQNGGHLVTTDWCLRNLIQKAFPDTILEEGRASGSFPIVVCDRNHPFLLGMTEAGGVKWEVEVASHRIRILDPKRVRTLLEAPEMGKHPAILVTFSSGAGQVTHAISHFHLQGGTDRGKYVSAYILTNIIEDAVAKRLSRGANGSRLQFSKQQPSLKSKLRIRLRHDVPPKRPPQ